VNPLPDGAIVLDDHNTVHPRSTLSYRSPQDEGARSERRSVALCATNTH
jgi:hypothetical protein